MMKEGIQTFLSEVGREGCYALSILWIAEQITGKPVDVAGVLDDAVEKGYIYYNRNNASDPNNLFVSAPHKLLAELTGRNVSVRKEPGAYQPGKNEYVVYRWERVSAGATYGHFRLPDFDPMQNSQTVKYGKIESSRVFTVC